MDDSLNDLPLRRIPAQGRSRDKVWRALLAADRILDVEGASALNLTRVAAAAGLSAGALHQYLPDRETIAAALAARYHARLEGLLEQAIAQPVGDDPVGVVLSAVSRVYRDEAALRILRLHGVAETDSQAHKARMAAKLRDALVAHRLVAPGRAALVARVAFLAADGVLHEAFRCDLQGEQPLLDELSCMLRAYIGQSLPTSGEGAAVGRE